MGRAELIQFQQSPNKKLASHKNREKIKNYHRNVHSFIGKCFLVNFEISRVHPYCTIVSYLLCIIGKTIMEGEIVTPFNAPSVK